MPREKNKHRAWRPQRPEAGDLKLDLRTLGFLSVLLQKPEDRLPLLFVRFRPLGCPVGLGMATVA